MTCSRLSTNQNSNSEYLTSHSIEGIIVSVSNLSVHEVVSSMHNVLISPHATPCNILLVGWHTRSPMPPRPYSLLHIISQTSTLCPLQKSVLLLNIYARTSPFYSIHNVSGMYLHTRVTFINRTQKSTFRFTETFVTTRSSQEWKNTMIDLISWACEIKRIITSYMIVLLINNEKILNHLESETQSRRQSETANWESETFITTRPTSLSKTRSAISVWIHRN